eukprot:5300928-Prymnesium_polylepis.1
MHVARVGRSLLLVQYFSEQCPLLRPDTSPGYTASCYLPGCDTHTDTHKGGGRAGVGTRAPVRRRRAVTRRAVSSS